MSKKVAIVEDNPDNLLLVQALLGNRYDIVAYQDSYEALNKLKNEQPDIILMDISMPVLDGVELLKKLRVDESTKDIPVIALTAHAMEGDREKYISLGFNDYLAKPIFDENLLFGAIESNLPG
ncbi:MAG: response regulator [Candidatus Marinimicrobia bacterium]|nr:response regulator [Candidatus Neomarinimicrobiota bacterium]